MFQIFRNLTLKLQFYVYVKTRYWLTILLDGVQLIYHTNAKIKKMF